MMISNSGAGANAASGRTPLPPFNWLGGTGAKPPGGPSFLGPPIRPPMLGPVDNGAIGVPVTTTATTPLPPFSWLHGQQRSPMFNQSAAAAGGGMPNFLNVPPEIRAMIAARRAAAGNGGGQPPMGWTNPGGFIPPPFQPTPVAPPFSLTSQPQIPTTLPFGQPPPLPVIHPRPGMPGGVPGPTRG